MSKAKKSKDNLNKEQKTAVLLPHNENALVIAGAGTGKTKTLISRIKELTKTFKPSEIVALTFTNKAAKEMEDRLDGLPINVGTFHSFALTLIKEDLERFIQFKTNKKDFIKSQQFYLSLFLKQNNLQEKWNELNKNKNNHQNKVKNEEQNQDNVQKQVQIKDFNLNLNKNTNLTFFDLLKNHSLIYFFEESKEFKTLNHLKKETETSEKFEMFLSIPFQEQMEKLKEKKHKPKIKLLDEEEQTLFIKELFQEQNWDVKNGAVAKLQDHINHQKENGVRSSKSKGRTKLEKQYQVYEEKILEMNILDFTELALLLKERLENDEFFRNYIHQKYRTFLVDEFQDTNPIQYELLNLLAGEKGVVFAVGDDCQSIYGFRGAEVKNIFKFKEKANFVKLEQNYRSTSNIVECSNLFILKAEEKIEKNLYTNNPKGQPIFIYKAKNEYEEAKFVCETIENLLKTEDYKDIAVIYRGNAQSAKIETLLSLRKIPYKVSGGMSFFDKADVKTLFALAKILVDPEDTHAFIRVAEKLYNLPKKLLEGWIIEANAEKLSFPDLIRYRKKEENLNKLLQYIEKGQDEFKYSTLKESFKDFLRNIDYKKEKYHYINEENLEFFLNEIDEYERNGGSSFYSFVKKIEQNKNLILEYDKNVVNLMTIHASKGLEFKYVFLIGVEDGVLPSTPSIEENNIEEERRLMYVGMTRAKEELIISFCETRFNGYEQVYYPPSRFLLDLDYRYLNPINTTWLPFPYPYGYDENNYNEEEKQYLNIKIDYNNIIEEQLKNIHLNDENIHIKEINEDDKNNKDVKDDINNDNEFVLDHFYFTKEGKGKLIKIEQNEFDEMVLTLEMVKTEERKKVLPDYEEVKLCE